MPGTSLWRLSRVPGILEKMRVLWEKGAQDTLQTTPMRLQKNAYPKTVFLRLKSGPFRPFCPAYYPVGWGSCVYADASVWLTSHMCVCVYTSTYVCVYINLRSIRLVDVYLSCMTRNILCRLTIVL
jgi:hypothetical protein